MERFLIGFFTAAAICAIEANERAERPAYLECHPIFKQVAMEGRGFRHHHRAMAGRKFLTHLEQYTLGRT